MNTPKLKITGFKYPPGFTHLNCLIGEVCEVSGNAYLGHKLKTSKGFYDLCIFTVCTIDE